VKKWQINIFSSTELMGNATFLFLYGLFEGISARTGSVDSF